MARMCWRSSLRAYLVLGSASLTCPRRFTPILTLFLSIQEFRGREQGREGRALIVGCWEGVPNKLSPAKVAAGTLYPVNLKLRISTFTVIRRFLDSPSTICFSLVAGSESSKYLCPKYSWIATSAYLPEIQELRD